MSRCKELRSDLTLAKHYSIFISHPKSFYMNYRQLITLLSTLRMHGNILYHNLPQHILLEFSKPLSHDSWLWRNVFFFNDCVILVESSQEKKLYGLWTRLLNNNQSELLDYQNEKQSYQHSVSNWFPVQAPRVLSLK